MPCRTEGSGSPCMFHDLAIITVTGELDLALCVELTPELNAAPALLSASDRHRPRGRLLGGLIGNRAAAQRHSAPRSHRTPTRDCLPTRIAAPRFRAHRPRSPAADARDPSRRTGCRRRQLIGGPPIRVRRTRRACLSTRTPSCSPWVCDSLTKCQTQAAVTASHDPAQEGQPLVTGLQAARCPTSDRGTHELSRRGRRSPLNARRDVERAQPSRGFGGTRRSPRRPRRPACRPRELGRIPRLHTPRDRRVDSGGQATRNSEQANRRYGREGSCQRSRQPMARPQ